MWLNITIYSQRELFTMIRQLQFALLRLLQQLDELSNSIQSAIQGSLSISPVNPTVLLNILKNVSLLLPEEYEYISVIREKIFTYFRANLGVISSYPSML